MILEKSLLGMLASGYADRIVSPKEKAAKA
jgi:hypothetical protein